MTTSGISLAPAAILFDLDGTLIDTYHLYLECYRRALEPHLGYAPTDEEIIARNPVSERRFLVDWIGEKRGAACHAEMRELYGELYSLKGEGTYGGVVEMLSALKSAGYPMGIVTGKSREAWHVTQIYSDLGYFDVVITDDDVHAPKPDPSGLLAAAAALGVEPAAAIYIGDSTSDLKAGRNAGMRIGAALWPKTAPGEKDAFLHAIEGMMPEWIFEHPSDITRAFALWC
ncbi:HAD family hydrolase [Longimicrobium sp.]|uniref:HAD family hydrolase n=1 Tax=Longimicrobium sp. TaxID=2029185 RepID=UPI002F93AB8E